MAWRHPANLMDIETALLGRKLYVSMRTNTWWLVRRNGATWLDRKRERWRIPLKAGLKSTFAISEISDLTSLRIAATQQDANGEQQ